MDIGNAEYVDNPVVANLTARQASKLADGYNLNFEPYASKYDNKLVVDKDANNELIGVMKRLPDANGNRSDPDLLATDKNNMDLNFEFQGPKRTSDERHYFKTIQDEYMKSIRSKKNSLSEMFEKNNDRDRKDRS